MHDATIRTAIVWALLILLPAQSHAQAAPPANAGAAANGTVSGAASAAATADLPPGADTANARLAASSRHGEWVDIAVANGPTLKTFVVYPERSTKAPVVIVIHEIFGLTEWIRGVADQLAKDGFIAIAPDLLSGKGPNGGGTDSLGDKATEVIRTLSVDDVVTRLNAVRDYALKIPAASGKTAVIGFCWGGGMSVQYALAQPALAAAVSYYGPLPSDPNAYASAKTPILGLYGGNDARVNETIAPAKTELEKAGVKYEPVTFEGAGHGFLRQQDNDANRNAARQAWPKTLSFLRDHTG